MKSPNNIVIDSINEDDIYNFHMDLHNLCEKYQVRVRIKRDGRTSTPLNDFNDLIERYKQINK